MGAVIDSRFVKACRPGTGAAFQVLRLDATAANYEYSVPGYLDRDATWTGKQTFSSLSAGAVALTAKGAPSQSANLQEWQNAAGTALSSVSPSGLLRSPAGSAALPSLSFQGDPNTGFYNAGSDDAISITLGGNRQYQLEGGEWFFFSDAAHVRMGSGSDAGLKRTGAAQLMVTNGSSGFGSLFVGTNSVSITPLTVRGVVSQTANLQEWQDATGAVISRIDSTGRIGIKSGNTGALGFDFHLFGSFGMVNAGGSAILGFNANGSISGTANVGHYLNGGLLIQTGSVTVLDAGLNAASVTTTAFNASTVPLIAKGAASQTASLQEWQSSSGAVLTRVNKDGLVGIGLAPVSWIDVTNPTGAATQTDGIRVHRDGQDGTLGGHTWTTMNTIGGSSNIVAAYRGGGGGNLQIWSYDGATCTSLARFGTVNQTLLVTAPLAGTIGLTVKGAASQSASLQEWQDSDGNRRSAFKLSGSSGVRWYGLSDGGFITVDNSVGVALEWSTYAKIVCASDGVTIWSGDGSTWAPHLSITTSGNVLVSGFPAAVVGLTVKGAASQTASLQDWQSSTGTALNSINSYGGLVFNTGTINIGSGAGNDTISGSDNVNIGTNSGHVLTSGSSNMLIGSRSGQILTTGSGNVAIGYFALSGTTAATQATVIGTESCKSATGNFTVAIGTNAGQTDAPGSVTLTSGEGNTLIGKAASVAVATQNYGIALGYQAVCAANEFTLSPNCTVISFTGKNTTITPATAAGIPLTVKGAASQTANLQEWQSSTGTALLRVAANGAITASNNIYIQANGSLNFSAVSGYGMFLTGNPLAIFPNYNGSSGLSVDNSYAATPACIGIIVKGATSQTANLQEWQDSTGAALAKVSAGGDVEITDSTKGIILKSPDGTRYRIKVANGGTLTITAL